MLLSIGQVKQLALGDALIGDLCVCVLFSQRKKRCVLLEISLQSEFIAKPLKAGSLCILAKRGTGEKGDDIRNEDHS